MTTNSEKIMQRQEANLEILKYLELLIKELPQQRFGQILSNYVLPQGDPFYEESVDTLERVKYICEEGLK